jgi:hypothetical protein
MVEEQIIEAYAIVGAMAVLFYAEPARTYDLDVAVALPQRRAFQPRARLRLAVAAGMSHEVPHVLVHEVPIQFLPGDSGLWGERCVKHGASLRGRGRPGRVPNIWWRSPGRRPPQRRERAAMLSESGSVDAEN